MSDSVDSEKEPSEVQFLPPANALVDPGRNYLTISGSDNTKAQPKMTVLFQNRTTTPVQKFSSVRTDL